MVESNQIENISSTVDYQIQPITAGVFQNVLPMLYQIDREKLRDPDLLFGEIALMLAEKDLLIPFLSAILEIGKEEAGQVPNPVGVINDFFTRNAYSFVGSGIFMSEEMRQNTLEVIRSFRREARGEALKGVASD